MRLLFFVFLIVLFASASGQQEYLDSLYQKVNYTKDDSAKVNAMSAIANYYAFNQFGGSIYYASKTLDLACYIQPLLHGILLLKESLPSKGIRLSWNL